MNYKPLGQRVLVKKQEETEKVLKSELIITDVAKDKDEVVFSRKATVIALGAGITRPDGSKLPFTVKIGDEVIIPYSYAEDKGLDGNAKITIIEESAINCICTPELKCGQKVSLKVEREFNGAKIKGGVVSQVLGDGIYIVDFGNSVEVSVSFDSLDI